MILVRNCILRLIFALVIAGSALFGQPAVNAGGIVNHFSLASSVMPNGSIAQGSLFDINGRNLGPAIRAGDGRPLTAGLAASSARMPVGAQAHRCPYRISVRDENSGTASFQYAGRHGNSRSR